MNLIVALLCSFMTGAAAAKPPKPTCSRRELERRDCRVTEGAHNYRILNETIAGSDGTWHSVNPIPLKGEGIEWEKIRFSLMNQRPILQFWLWDKGVGEAQVQSMHWYVVDLDHNHFSVLVDAVVQKRHLKQSLTVAEPAASKAPAKPSYLYDKMEAHGLKALKSGALEWNLGKEKKLIEKVNHGI